MIRIGNINRLRVLRKVDFGVYLNGEDYDSILLPKKYVPADCEVDDLLDVFIYFDSDDRIIATTEKPFAMVGDIACLKVVAVNSTGAFLDWGLPKDLLVPFSEQNKKMKENEFYVVQIYLDERTNRIVASSRLNKFLSDVFPEEYSSGTQVDLLIADKTDFGFTTVVDDYYLGVLYDNEVFEELKLGQKITGYIKKIRSDGKADITLYKKGYGRITDLSKLILDKLESNGGFLPVTDKSAPELISKMFGASKKSYKKAIGALYKKRLITLENDGIKITRQDKL